MEAVAANVPLLGQFPVDRIRRGSGRQVVEEGGIEDRDVRQVRQQPAGDLDPEDGRRVVQRGQRCEGLERGDQLVVDRRGPVEIGPTVYDAVPHRDQALPVQVQSGRRQRFERRAQRRLVVRDLALTDALDDAVGQLSSRIRFDHRVFQ